MTHLRTIKRNSVFAAVMSASLVLAGCGINLSSDNSNDNQAQTQETSFTEALDRADDWSTTDPRNIEGRTDAPAIGDVTPITDSPEPNLPVSLTDADGNDVTVTDVSRILAMDLYGTTTRTIAGLGLRDNIVGRAVSSEEPSLKDLPVVTTGSHDINVEAVLNLQPTVMVVDHSIGPAEAIDKIRDSGVTVVVVDPERTIDAIGEDIKAIAGTLGVNKEGEQLAQRANDERDQAMSKIKDIAPSNPMRAAFMYTRGNGGAFFIVGRERGTEDLFSAVGAEDTSVNANIPDMVPGNAESLAKLNPEVIVMMTSGLESAGGVQGLLEKPGMSETDAGKKQRFVAIPDSQALSFGPQTGEMLLAFAEALYVGK